jgi:hypothetical protein
MYEDAVFQSELYQNAVSLWGGALSKTDEDWLEDLQDALWKSLEGHYIDIEEQSDEFIHKILRLQKYTMEKAVMAIVRYCALANNAMNSGQNSAG